MIEEYQDTVVQKSIDGIEYSSSKFPASKALSLLSRTTRVLGEHGLQALVASQAKALAESAPRLVLQTQPRLYSAMVQVAYGLSEDLQLVRDLTANLKCSALRPAGTAGLVSKAFDTHFMGELPHLYQVLAFVLAHNFMGFTLGSDSMGGSLTPDGTTEEPASDLTTPSEESSPPTSTP